MRILIIMGGFFPGKKYGGPPVSVNNFCSLMKGHHECYIVTHNHDMEEQTPYDSVKSGWNDRGNAKVMYLSDKEYKKFFFERIIEELHPDYIYLQGLFQGCVLPCLQLAKKHHLKVLLAPRGELCAGAFRKKYKKIPYILYLHIMGLLKEVEFQSTSDEETEAIKRYLKVEEGRIHFLTNIPSIPTNLSQRARKEAGKGDFVFISRILWKKNLLKAIHYLKDIKGDVRFDIYGPKEDLVYWEDCQKIINELPKTVRVNYCGVLSHDEIHATFNQYDAFLFPTLSENFGHVIAESLVTGCIPIISDHTPWTDINQADAGWALALGDDIAFINAIQQVVEMDDGAIKQKRDNIKRYLGTKLKLDQLKNDYLNVFR